MEPASSWSYIKWPWTVPQLRCHRLRLLGEGFTLCTLHVLSTPHVFMDHCGMLLSLLLCCVPSPCTPLFAFRFPPSATNNKQHWHFFGNFNWSDRSTAQRVNWLTEHRRTSWSHLRLHYTLRWSPTVREPWNKHLLVWKTQCFLGWFWTPTPRGPCTWQCPPVEIQIESDTD